MLARFIWSSTPILLAVIMVIILHEMTIFMQLLIFEIALVSAFVIDKQLKAMHEGVALWRSLREGMYAIISLILFFAVLYTPVAWAIKHWLA